MARQRKLTAGEIALARAAFGKKVEYGRVRLCDGPGLQPLAHAAFAKGNPAITVGSTVYFKVRYCPDFSAPGEDRKGFMHEMTHVWQYQTLGMPAFFARYGAELARAGGNPNDMYKYTEATKFNDAMLEAQAQIVGDYHRARTEGNAAATARLARNLAGSGLHGL